MQTRNFINEDGQGFPAGSMRKLTMFCMALVGGVLLLALSAVPAAGEGPGPDSDGSQDPLLKFFNHDKKVTPDELVETVFRFSTKDVDEDPANLTFKMAWARTSYGDDADQALADLNGSAEAKKDDGRGAGGRSEGSTNVSRGREDIEKQYALEWHPLPLSVAQIGNSTRFSFQLTVQNQLAPGYYLLRVQVQDSEANQTLMWLYSKDPLLVYYTQLKEKVELKVHTFPDYPNSTLFFRVKYKGPFLENPLALISAAHLGLVNHRVNISGLMEAKGGELMGNYSFAPEPIPKGAYTFHIKGVDAANRTISVNSHFIIQAHNLTKDQDNELESETGRLKISLKVKQDLVDGLLSIEELDANPGKGLNATKLKLKYQGQIPPGRIHSLGRYLSVEPSAEVRQQMANATLRFYVNATDLDENGTVLGQRIHGLRVFYYNETSSEWELVLDSRYDAAHGYVWANIPHFSIYGLFGSNVAPTASIDPVSLTVKSGEEFTLQGEGVDLDGEVVEWAWDLDDDGQYEQVSSTSGALTHTYTSGGTHYAKLRVSDEQGATGFTQITVVVKDESEGNGDSPMPLPLWISLVAISLALLLVALRRF